METIHHPWSSTGIHGALVGHFQSIATRAEWPGKVGVTTGWPPGDHRVTTGWPPGDHRLTGSIERNHSGANTPCVTTSLEAWQAWRQEQTENRSSPVCCPYPLLTPIHSLHIGYPSSSHFKPKLHWRWLVWATAHFHAEARRAPNCDRQSIDAFSPATVGYEGRVVSVDQGLV